MHDSGIRARRRASTFRRFGWLAVALMVILSIAGPGTAGVAAAAPGEGGSSGLSVQAVGPNPGPLHAYTSNPKPPSDVCKEADFGFAIDRSGSIGAAPGADAAEKGGINGFVDSFEAIGSGLYAGTRFNVTNANNAANITSGFVAAGTFKSAVTGMAATTGRTPTSAGITLAGGNTANHRTSPAAPKVMFVVTDGSPNVPWSNANINTNYPADPQGWLAGANAAIDAANAARAAGWIVNAIFVGAPDSGLSSAMNNPTKWVQDVMTAIGGGAYVQIADFGSLADALLVTTGCVTPPGSIKITKNVTQDSAGFPGGTFGFSVDCGSDGTFTTSIDIAKDGTSGTATIDKIPAGASCTVSETSKPAPVGDYQWLAPDISPNPVTIASGKTATVTVSNPRDFVEKPALTLVKSATPGTYSAVDQSISYSYKLTNSGNVTLAGPFTVSDDKATATCPASPSSLAPGDFTTCTATYTIAQADLDSGSVTNVAQGHAHFGQTVVNSNTDTKTVTAKQSPALGLDKTVAETSYDTVGNVLHYSYKLTNSGNVTLAGPFTVSDDKATATCPASPSSLAPGDFTTCTATYTIAQADLDSGSVTNVAQGHAHFGQTVVNSNTDTKTVTAKQSPALGLVKSATPGTYSAVDQSISYSYKLTNTGNVTLSGPFTVSDDKATASCPATASLAPAAFITCTASYSVTQADLDSGSVTNVAQGHAHFGQTVVDSNTDTKTVTAVAAPDLHLIKKATPTTYDHVGQVISYSYQVENMGNVTLSGPVTVSDDKATVTCPDVASLAPGGSVTCTATYTITQADIDSGSVTNLAKASAGGLQSNEDTQTVHAVQNADMTITKDVSLNGEDYASYVTAMVGQTVHYRIVVTNIGNVTLTDVTLEDSLFNSKLDSCEIPATLAVGHSFTCEYTDTASVYKENTATATSRQAEPVDDTATVYIRPTTTLIVKKYLDIPNLKPAPAPGWTFKVSGDPELTGTTGANGLYSFDFTGIDGSTTVDVSEVMQKNFKFVSASCEGPVLTVDTAPQAVTEPRGKLVGGVMTDVTIHEGETVTCTFHNKSGEVAGETATPKVTPPPTDTLPVNGTPGGDSWRLVLLALAGVLASMLILNPATPKAVRRRR